MAGLSLRLLALPASLPQAVARSLHASAANLGKKYAKYYFTPKKIRRKEEIYRIHRTDAILPQERLTPLAIPQATPLSAQESDLLAQLTAAVTHPESGLSRMFAVVHLIGKQYKVSEGDLVQLVGKSYVAEPGDEVILEKVLALGCADFTLYGRPILSRDCVTIRATIVEKTLEAPRIRFEFKKRQNFRRMNVMQTNATVLRIGAIQLNKAAMLSML